MAKTIREWVTVKAGGLVELRIPELSEGTQAEVIVIPEQPLEKHSAEQKKLKDFFGACKGMFTDSKEVDQYIRELRDEWE